MRAPKNEQQCLRAFVTGCVPAGVRRKGEQYLHRKPRGANKQEVERYLYRHQQCPTSMLHISWYLHSIWHFFSALAHGIWMYYVAETPPLHKSPKKPTPRKTSRRTLPIPGDAVVGRWSHLLDVAATTNAAAASTSTAASSSPSAAAASSREKTRTSPSSRGRKAKTAEVSPAKIVSRRSSREGGARGSSPGKRGHVCKHVRIYKHTRGNLSIYVYTYTYVNTHTHRRYWTAMYMYTHIHKHTAGKDSGMSVLDRAAQLRAQRDSQESSASVSVSSRGRHRSPAGRRRRDASLSVLDRAAQRRAQKDEI